MEQLVRELVISGVLKTEHIINAFRHIDRVDFVPKDLRHLAYMNEPLSIGYGQTISQPWTVAFMLELLNPLPGQKILDIGSGSGWQTALLSYIVSHDKHGNLLPEEDSGKVVGVELIPELAKESRAHIGKYSFIKKHVAEVHCLSAEHGFPEEAPFQRIIAAASAYRIPDIWKEELDEGGIIVAPVKSRIMALYKKDGTFTEKAYEGFAFVPFVEDDQES